MQSNATELPHLRLGTAGFDDAQLARLQDGLSRATSGMDWRLGGLETADAWCLNGARTMILADGGLQVSSASGPFTVRIRAGEGERPIVFATPATAQLAESCETFDLDSLSGTRAMLEKLEGWLRPAAIRFWLGWQIMQRRPDLSDSVFHVSVNGRMVAVVSRLGVGVLPIADPLRLHQAVWARRPLEAGEIPSHYLRCGLAEVLWTYAMRTDRALMPPSLRAGAIHWRGAPPLPQRLFADAHLLIARELAQAPATFEELRGRTGLADADLARALAALRIVGAIVSQRKWAARATDRPARRVPANRIALAAERPWSEKTAPAPLSAPRA